MKDKTLWKIITTLSLAIAVYAYMAAGKGFEVEHENKVLKEMVMENIGRISDMQNRLDSLEERSLSER